MTWPKRVHNTRINRSSKKGGSRSGGMWSGLVSTSARAGIYLFRQIKRRTVFITEEVSKIVKLFQENKDLDTFIDEGIETNEIIENIGITGTADLIVKSSTNSKNILNDVGILDEDLEKAGVKINEDGSSDFTNFSIRKALTDTEIRPTQIFIAANSIMTQNNNISENTNQISNIGKLISAAEIGDIYMTGLSDAQKENADKLIAALGLQENVAAGDWSFVLG